MPATQSRAAERARRRTSSISDDPGLPRRSSELLRGGSECLVMRHSLANGHTLTVLGTTVPTEILQLLLDFLGVLKPEDQWGVPIILISAIRPSPLAVSRLFFVRLKYAYALPDLLGSHCR
jgi:hypothetical protein